MVNTGKLFIPFQGGLEVVDAAVGHRCGHPGTARAEEGQALTTPLSQQTRPGDLLRHPLQRDNYKNTFIDVLGDYSNAIDADLVATL